MPFVGSCPTNILCQIKCAGHAPMRRIKSTASGWSDPPRRSTALRQPAVVRPTTQQACVACPHSTGHRVTTANDAATTPRTRPSRAPVTNVFGSAPSPSGGRLAGVKNGVGSPADADVFLGCEPVGQPGAGARPGRVTHCCFEHADQNFGFP